MWASGHYENVATDLISELGPTLVEATQIHEGDLVLDIAAGSGNVAIPAARTGARVIASDLTPELLEEGTRQAAAAGVVLEWQVADAEHLPYDDDEFDVAVSAVGIMFAPHHQEAADELVRVVAPGGRIGLASWTPQGFIGQMFATMKPYVAPRPPASRRRRCGATRTTSARCSATASPTCVSSAARYGSPTSPSPPTSASTSRPTTARRSRRTSSSRTPSARPLSTPTSTRSPSASTSVTPATWCWTGSTCW